MDSYVKAQALIPLTLSSAALQLIVAYLQAASMLTELGFTTIFSKVSISGAAKIQLTLYLTLSVLGATAVILGGLTIRRGQSKRGSVASGVGIVFSLVSLVLPRNFGFALSTITMAGTVVAAAMMAAVSIIGLKTKPVRAPNIPLLTTVEVSTTAIFSAMTAVLIATTGQFMPSPTGGYTHIGDTTIFLAALLFGSKVGALTGAIGSVVADLYVGYSRWYVSIPAHAIEGAIAGLAKKRDTTSQIILCAVGGILMASVYFFMNVFIKGFPIAIISYARDLFGQAGISMILGVALAKTIRRMLPQLEE